MKKLLLSGIVFAAMSSAALAAEPLTEKQMDTVTAGQLTMFTGVVVWTEGNLNSTTGLDVNFRTQSFNVITFD